MPDLVRHPEKIEFYDFRLKAGRTIRDDSGVIEQRWNKQYDLREKRDE
jgi:hypothetical protein